MYRPQGIFHIVMKGECYLRELWSNLVYDEFIKRRPDLSFHSV